MALLTVDDLRIYYQTLKGEVRSADNISFGLRQGEILGIAGESGCGKSTLCQALILLKPPMKYVSGKVFLNDEEVPVYDYERMRPFRYQKISIVPQYALDALNPIRKIGRLIEELLDSHGRSYAAIKDRLAQRLQLVRLPLSVLNLYPFELSGGMKQRLVMVLATLLNPTLLICDEITSALDVSSQKAVVEMAVQFIKEKITQGILFITHDISVLYQIADSLMIMYAGKVSERAATEILLKKPLHPYSKLLISSLPEIGIRYVESKLKGIPGKPPSLLNPPAGCRFKPRCPEADDRCDAEPPLKELQANHFAACWRRIEEIA